MSTATAPVHAVPEPAASSEKSFLANRVASLVSILPLGVWTANHIWNQLSVYKSGSEWEKQVTTYEHPYAAVGISIVVLLPLLIHTVWGVGRLFKARPNNLRYGFFDNLRYGLQRLAAIGVFFFLGAHLWLAFLHPRFFGEGHPEAFSDIAHEMHWNGPTLPVYLLGTLGVCYHLGNGIAAMGMGWGLATSQKGMKRWEIFGLVIFGVLLVMSWAAIYGIWDAGTNL